MERIEDNDNLFFIHTSNSGYQVAFRKKIYHHSVVISKSDKEIAEFDSRDQEYLSVYDIYDYIYRWLDYGPTDVESKCERLKRDNFHVRIQLLPTTESHIEIPNLDIYYIKKINERNNEERRNQNNE